MGWPSEARGSVTRDFLTKNLEVSLAASAVLHPEHFLGREGIRRLLSCCLCFSIQ